MAGILSSISSGLYSVWNQIYYAVSNIRIVDVIDILVVAFLLYRAFVFLRETRAGQLVKGIVVLVVVYIFANVFKLIVLQWVLSVVFNSAIIVVAVVFQPEIRRILERVGRTKLSKARFTGDKSERISDAIDQIGKAARNMQENKIGALIVFERETQLGEIINTGTVIDANTSASLVGNIFFPKSPLHDGAVIVRDGKIYAAGCILPLTQSNAFSSDLGTRHRAAIGMSENSDAVILVVSEETGNISIVNNGEIKRGYNGVSAAQELKQILVDDELDKEDSKVFSAVRPILPFSSKKKSKESEAAKHEEK